MALLFNLLCLLALLFSASAHDPPETAVPTPAPDSDSGSNSDSASNSGSDSPTPSKTAPSPATGDCAPTPQVQADLENSDNSTTEVDVPGQVLQNQKQKAPPAELEAEKAVQSGAIPPTPIDPAVNLPPTEDNLPPTAAPAYNPGFGGSWELHSENSGVSAMHLMIMPLTNMAIMYDATVLGASMINLTAQQGCRAVVDGPVTTEDCYAHAVEYCTTTGLTRPLKVNTDTWCSSGSLTIEGALVGVGGNKEGAKTVRYLSPCVDCEWREYPNSLADPRWYGTQTVLADNRYIVVGGRAALSYEYMPLEGNKNEKPFFFQFLKDTTDIDENNLYPFIHLSTDGNVFIFANDRSVLLNPYNNQIIREYPVLDGGARNYPASGSSAILPLRPDIQDPASTQPLPTRIMVCGGAKKEAYAEAGKKNFMPALDDCNTITITDPNPTWVKEIMPSPRVMGDMLLLPNMHVLLINGAKRGTSAWWYAEDPNFVPVLYVEDGAPDKKFIELAPSAIARMYHSTSGVLIDGKILVAGSNTHDFYKFDVKYPTELRVEKFSPPYLDPALKPSRPEIQEAGTEVNFSYGKLFKIIFTVQNPTDRDSIKVTLYSPAFTTHGCNMNQRILSLPIKDIVKDNSGAYTLTVASPMKPEYAPAGYYMMFVCNGVLPSSGVWAHLKR